MTQKTAQTIDTSIRTLTKTSAWTVVHVHNQQPTIIHIQYWHKKYSNDTFTPQPLMQWMELSISSTKFCVWAAIFVEVHGPLSIDASQLPCWRIPAVLQSDLQTHVDLFREAMWPCCLVDGERDQILGAWGVAQQCQSDTFLCWLQTSLPTSCKSARRLLVPEQTGIIHSKDVFGVEVDVFLAIPDRKLG